LKVKNTKEDPGTASSEEQELGNRAATEKCINGNEKLS